MAEGYVDPATDDEFLTAPTSDYAEVVLTSLHIDGDPADAVLDHLADPVTYTHVLDMRQMEERRDA